MEKEDTDLKGSKISEEQSLLMSGTPCGPNRDSELFLQWKAISIQAAFIGRSLLENSEPSSIVTQFEAGPIVLNDCQSATIVSENETSSAKFSDSEMSYEKLLQVSGLSCGPDGDSNRFQLWREISFQAASIGRSRLDNSVKA